MYPHSDCGTSAFSYLCFLGTEWVTALPTAPLLSSGLPTGGQCNGSAWYCTGVFKTGSPNKPSLWIYYYHQVFQCSDRALTKPTLPFADVTAPPWGAHWKCKLLISCGPAQEDWGVFSTKWGKWSFTDISSRDLFIEIWRTTTQLSI